MSVPVPHGFVFYPRSYSIDEQNADLSYVDGVDIDGVERRVFLNPDQRARDAAKSGTAETIPMINKLAETGRRATNPCFANPDNGAESPYGVLLIEQASARADGHVESRWASVLSESNDTPAPSVGIGGLEMYYHAKVSDETSGLLAQYRRLLREEGIDAIAERTQLFNKILDSRRVWAVVSILKPEETVTMSDSGAATNTASIRAIADPFLEKYTKDGHYGGVWIRVRTGDMVDPVASVMVNRQFDYSRGVVQSLDDVWEGFEKWQSGKVKSAARQSGVSIDIVPVERINAGKAGNDKFKKDWHAHPDGGVPKLQKLYVDRSCYLNPLQDAVKSGAQLVAYVAVREALIYSGATAGNRLVSTIHSISKPLGHPLMIGPDGDAIYQIKGRQGADKAQEQAQSAEPAGMSR